MYRGPPNLHLFSASILEEAFFCKHGCQPRGVTQGSKVGEHLRNTVVGKRCQRANILKVAQAVAIKATPKVSNKDLSTLVE